MEIDHATNIVVNPWNKLIRHVIINIIIVLAWPRITYWKHVRTRKQFTCTVTGYLTTMDRFRLPVNKTMKIDGFYHIFSVVHVRGLQVNVMLVLCVTLHTIFPPVTDHPYGPKQSNMTTIVIMTIIYVLPVILIIQ